MKLHVVLGIGLLLAGTGVAFAEDNASIPEPSVQPRGTYVTTDPSRADIIPVADIIAAGAPCRLIYLNNCQNEPDQRCVVRPGFESSINDTSSIINQTAYLDALPFTTAEWNALLQCVRETYAPFNINVTDVDPGNVCHWENVVAGSPGDAGMPSGVGGVSPWGTCGVIQNSITYTFAEVYGPNIPELCWTVAQETAHSFALEHELLAEDPMTYLSGSNLPGGFKRFQNQTVNCGEYQPRSCDCGGTTQNSVQMLLDIFGASTPTPPVVSITSPGNGSQVDPGFPVRADIQDNNGVAQATLYINDEAVQTITSSPWALNAPATLGEGTYSVKVVAVDNQGTSGESPAISVFIGPPCSDTDDCQAQGDGLTCVDGRCVPGPDLPGGLGTECEDDAQCASGRCEHSTNDGNYCVESCDPAADGCPGGFQCLDAGVCWPGDDDGGFLGVCQAGDSGRVPTLPIALGIALGFLTLRRRRRT